MGPIEFFFITLIVLMGLVGLARRSNRELGVTTLLLLTLFVITFLETEVNEQLMAVAGRIGISENEFSEVFDLVAVAVLLFVGFISYQGETLVFPGSGSSGLGLVLGLVNGYLLFGSVWHYLAQANYPFVEVVPDFSALYQLLLPLLPPAILTWPYFVFLAVAMLILRVLK
ncbi:MAG: hypothetical protein NZ528_13980 [Caldilineales bacterium]|nr:hypothetical protein [Caldilineales bacterium]MDW8316301.1 hypothetical protein [Anaerolineae bacterium]